MVKITIKYNDEDNVAIKMIKDEDMSDELLNMRSIIDWNIRYIKSITMEQVGGIDG